MRTAKKIAQSYELTCAKCDATIPDPHSGSLYWTVGEMNSAIVLTCPDCGTQMKMPKS